MMHRMSGYTQLAEKVTTSRINQNIATYITKSIQKSEDSTNPVYMYELMTDNLQLVLTNVQFAN